MINLHPDSRPPHARQFSFECTENRHWMEIMKALVQGSGKEYKFGNARWGKEGGGKPRAAHFSHTVSVGVTQSWGRKLRLRVELVCLPKELEICSRAQEKNSALLQFGVLFCQKTTSESKSNTSCKLVFLASCWAWEESPFSKESNKKKKILFSRIFTAMWEEEKLSVLLRVSQRAGLKCWITLKQQTTPILAPNHVFFKQADLSKSPGSYSSLSWFSCFQPQ